MLFNSYIFILIFLPLTLLGYYILNHFKRYEMSKAFLAGMSLWFYAYFDVKYLGVIVSSVLINYLLSYIILRKESRSGNLPDLTKRIFVILGISFNLGVLIYFKYLDFIIENINLVIKGHINTLNILLPLGISFFTFQQLSFIIDRALGRAKHYKFINYLTFVTFFPQLVAGPIVLYDEMMPQFEDVNNKKFSYDNFTRGVLLFTFGLAKKVLLADVLAVSVNFGFDNALFLDSVSTALLILAYTFQLYFDFSGYSDMAIGLGRMFNIELPVNFNSPYKAASVKEFWQRWHITLSRFFIKYVYIPMGGSRKGRIRTLFNVFMIFFLSGIWHGANWTYIVWGIMHGIAVVWDNLYIIGVKDASNKKEPKIIIPRFAGWFFTFVFFNLSLIFFRSENLSTAFTLFKNLFSFKYTGYLPKLTSSLNIPELYLIEKIVDLKAPQFNNMLSVIIFILFMILCTLIIKGKNAYELAKCRLTAKTAVVCALLLSWCIISFSQVSTFIYFNF